MSDTIPSIELKKTRTDAARSVLKEKLAGMSPRQKGHEREKKALEWVLKWGWASPTTLEILNGTERSGLGLRLIKNKLLYSNETEGITTKYIPGSYLTLTRLGYDQICEDLELSIDYSFNERPNLMMLKHDEIVQRRTAVAMSKGAIVDYVTEKQMFDKVSEPLVKRHDALWTLKDGTKAGIEVEITPKYNRDLDQFVRSCLVALKSKEEHSPDLIYIITNLDNVMKNYGAAFAPNAPYNKWYKDKEKNRWIKEDAIGRVPADLSAKVMFEQIPKK